MPSTSRSALAPLVAASALAIAPLTLAAPHASAAPTPARVAPASATDDCLASGKIWLVVQSSKGSLMHNQCVAVGKNGEALLTEAGVKLTKDAKGFICAMDGEPAKCPAKFDGNYWQYYTATKGGKWTYATKGANESKPVAGTLEGWCYGTKCTPAMPALAGGAAASASASSSASSPASSSASPSAASSSSASSTAASDSDQKSTPWGTIVASVVIVALGAAAFLALRRRNR